MQDTRVAMIGIIVEDYASADALNEILHQYGKYIICLLYTSQRNHRRKRDDNRRKERRVAQRKLERAVPERVDIIIEKDKFAVDRVIDKRIKNHDKKGKHKKEQYAAEARQQKKQRLPPLFSQCGGNRFG